MDTANRRFRTSVRTFLNSAVFDVAALRHGGKQHIAKPQIQTRISRDPGGVCVVALALVGLFFIVSASACTHNLKITICARVLGSWTDVHRNVFAV